MYGDPTDLSVFGGAVIDGRSFAKLSGALDRIKNSASCTVLAGGTADDTEGWFVSPTLVECSDPAHDKAGSALNLVRWVSPRTIKETFEPPVSWRYPHMG